MATNNFDVPSDRSLLYMLQRFQETMRAMAGNGVPFHTFIRNMKVLYVEAAVQESKGNYCEAARKIDLHRNDVTRIMKTYRASQYAERRKQKNGGESER